MSEQEPVLRLNLGNEIREVKRDNSHLFTHMGRLAMYDHIFLVSSQEDGKLTGTYLFHNLQLNTETFTRILHFMVEHSYHTDLNRDDVPQCDIDAYEANLALYSDDLGDTIPDEFFNA